jgi:hypothetical protein
MIASPFSGTIGGVLLSVALIVVAMFRTLDGHADRNSCQTVRQALPNSRRGRIA